MSGGSSFCRFFRDSHPCATCGQLTVRLGMGGSCPMLSLDNTLAQENNKTVSVSAGKQRQSERGNNSSTTGHAALEDNLPSKMLGWRYQNSLEVAHFKRFSVRLLYRLHFPAILVGWFWVAISSAASCSLCGLRWIGFCFCSCSQGLLMALCASTASVGTADWLVRDVNIYHAGELPESCVTRRRCSRGQRASNQAGSLYDVVLGGRRACDGQKQTALDCKTVKYAVKWKICISPS